MEILLAQLVPLIYAAVSPFVTELIKAAADRVVASVPKNAIPIMGAVAGGIAGGVAQAIDPTIDSTTVVNGVATTIPIHVLSGLTPLTGVVAGFAGTGLHQAAFADQYERTTTGVPNAAVKR